MRKKGEEEKEGGGKPLLCEVQQLRIPSSDKSESVFQSFRPLETFPWRVCVAKSEFFFTLCGSLPVGHRARPPRGQAPCPSAATAHQEGTSQAPCWKSAPVRRTSCRGIQGGSPPCCRPRGRPVQARLRPSARRAPPLCASRSLGSAHCPSRRAQAPARNPFLGSVTPPVEVLSRPLGLPIVSA